MPEALPYSKNTPGRTFIVAISVLGLIALTQLGALGWAFVKRLKAVPAVATTSTATMSGSVTPTPQDGESDKETLLLTSPFDDPNANLAIEENSKEPIMPPAKPSPVPLARLQLAPDSRIGEMLSQGRTLRERGDTSNALLRFREANAADPQSPEAISEIAVTLEKMGLPEKAAENWKRVFDMGESAGVYFSAAEAKMREAVMSSRVSIQQPAADASVQSGGGTAPTATFGVGAVENEDLRDAKALKHLILRVPIHLRLKTKINVKDLFIQVIFYDLVDDKPVRTNANVSNRWSTAPVDWREDETEVLEVEYNQPVPETRDPKPENRNYYGYLVRVYYKDELQATRSEPAGLGQRFPASQTLEKDAAQ